MWCLSKLWNSLKKNKVMKNQNLKSKFLQRQEQNLAELKSSLDVLNPETLESVTGGINSHLESEANPCGDFSCAAYKNCGVV